MIGAGGPGSSRAPCVMPLLPLVMARKPESVRVSCRTVILASGFEMTVASFTKVQRERVVAVVMSIPFRDEITDGFAASANYFHYIVTGEQCTVT